MLIFNVDNVSKLVLFGKYDNLFLVSGHSPLIFLKTKKVVYSVVVVYSIAVAIRLKSAFTYFIDTHLYG